MKRILDSATKALTHPLMKNSAVVFIGTMVANVFSYGYHLVVGRLLGPEQYGELASLFSFSYILNVPSLVLTTVLTKHIAEFRSQNETGKAKSLSIRVMKWLSWVIVLGTVAIVPFSPFMADFLHIRHPSAVFFTFLTSALWLFTVVQSSLLQGFQRFLPAMVLTNVSVLFRLMGGIVGGMMGMLETVVAGFVTGFLGLLAYFLPLSFVYRAKAEPTGLTKKDVFAYSWSSLVTMLGITSLYSIDIMLAKHYLPPVEAGFYAALSVMGKIIFFASSSVSFVLFPVVAERTKQREQSAKLVYFALGAVAAVSFGITAIYAAFPDFSLSLLFGNTYRMGSRHLGLFGAFISFYSLSYLLATVLLGSGKMLVWFFVSVASVVQVVLIVLFHRDIPTILSVNAMTLAGLFVSLLLYYRHALKEH